MDTKLTISQEKLVSNLTPRLEKALTDLLSETEADVKGFVQAIVDDYARAYITNDTDLKEQLDDQVLALAEVHRIRVEGWLWPLVKQTLALIFEAAIGGALAVVMA